MFEDYEILINGEYYDLPDALAALLEFFTAFLPVIIFVIVIFATISSIKKTAKRAQSLRDPRRFGEVNASFAASGGNNAETKKAEAVQLHRQQFDKMMQYNLAMRGHVNGSETSAKQQSEFTDFDYAHFDASNAFGALTKEELIKKLAQIEEFRKSGFITKQEFAEQRAKLLVKISAAPSQCDIH